MDEILCTAWILKYLPLRLERLPEWICHKIAPVTIPLLDEQHDRDPEEKRAVFDTFIRDSSDGLPRWKLIDEGAAFQMAATDTTANMYVNGTFHLLTNWGILLKLRKELDKAWINIKEDMKYERLEHLSYLGATIVGCAAYIVHSNPTLFPDPKKFIPDFWLGENMRQLEKYLVAFSKGPRICLGIKLENIQFRDYILSHYKKHLHVQVSIKCSALPDCSKSSS
ncbi:cytochrome P450 [Marasmius fiardii PR-910]|nr:cytochrome P450 [Marasmius fiardii PR-910]